MPADAAASMPSDAGRPERWGQADKETLRRLADRVASEEPHSYACRQYGRYARWSKDSRGKWYGERLASGNAFTIRNQLHMAIGLRFIGKWFVPLDDASTVRVDGSRVVQIAFRDDVDNALFSFDSNGALEEAAFSYSAEDLITVRLQVRERRSAMGVMAPECVAVVPNEHLPMFFYVVRYGELERLPGNMLEAPPTSRTLGVVVGSCVDRLTDPRTEPAGAEQKIRRDVERENRRMRSSSGWVGRVALATGAGVLLFVLLSWWRRVRARAGSSAV